MTPSRRATDLIKAFEGFRATAYKCRAGVPTIGYGHTRTVKPTDIGVKTITQAQAEELLHGDLVRAGIDVERVVKIGITQPQFDALCSFVFNCGFGNFSGSTLLRRLNAARFDDARREFAKWTKARDPKTKAMIELPGLVRRRAAEAELFGSAA